MAETKGRGFWIRAEDLVVAWVGPFATEAEGLAHIAFCDARGDAAHMVVGFRDDGPEVGEFVISPEDDRSGVTTAVEVREDK